MKDMKKFIVILFMVAANVLPTIAQSFGAQEQPQSQFRSTSTMTGSGSSYSANPSINKEGTANAPAYKTGPHKAPTPIYTEEQRLTNGGGSGTNTPLGDAVLPLMLCAGAYLIIRARRRMVRSKMSEKGMEK